MSSDNANVTGCNVLSALRSAGEETRLRLLLLLMRGERTVKDLTFILEQSQPRISRHLKLLLDSHLVERYQEGSWVYYRLAENELAAKIRALLVGISSDDQIIAEDISRAEILREEKREKAQTYFLTHAEDWDNIRANYFDEKKLEKLMLATFKAAEQVGLAVDLGVGTGHTLELLGRRARRAVGIDINPSMLKMARMRLEAKNLSHCQLRQGDLQNLPFEDDSADIVLMHLVLHYLETPEKAIEEAARILAPGGQLLIVDFAAHDLEFLRDEHAHLRLGFEEKTISNCLNDLGLDNVLTQSLSSSTSKSNTITEKLNLLIWSAENARAKELKQTPTKDQPKEKQEI